MTKTKTHNGISYTKVGHGPHLCFLHGFCESKVIWDRAIAELKDSYTCTAIDLPGFGDSANSAFHSMEDVAKQIVALWQHEAMTQVVVLGHSMGGYVMSAIAKLAPEYISALGFIHSTSRADSDEKKENRQKTLDFISRHGTAEFFTLFAEALVSPNNLKALLPQIRLLIESTSPRSITDASLAMMQRQDHLPTIAALKIPVLFVHGADDAHLKAHDIYHQASRCTRSQISWIEDCGHLSMLETPAQFTHILQEFLRFVAAQA